MAQCRVCGRMMTDWPGQGSVACESCLINEMTAEIDALRARLAEAEARAGKKDDPRLRLRYVAGCGDTALAACNDESVAKELASCVSVEVRGVTWVRDMDMGKHQPEARATGGAGGGGA